MNVNFFYNSRMIIFRIIVSMVANDVTYISEKSLNLEIKTVWNKTELRTSNNLIRRNSKLQSPDWLNFQRGRI